MPRNTAEEEQESTEVENMKVKSFKAHLKFILINLNTFFLLFLIDGRR